MPSVVAPGCTDLLADLLRALPGCAGVSIVVVKRQVWVFATGRDEPATVDWPAAVSDLTDAAQRALIVRTAVRTCARPLADAAVWRAIR